jgi:hypothetical protein
LSGDHQRIDGPHPFPGLVRPDHRVDRDAMQRVVGAEEGACCLEPCVGDLDGDALDLLLRVLLHDELEGVAEDPNPSVRGVSLERRHTWMVGAIPGRFMARARPHERMWCVVVGGAPLV